MDIGHQVVTGRGCQCLQYNRAEESDEDHDKSVERLHCMILANLRNRLISHIDIPRNVTHDLDSRNVDLRSVGLPLQTGLEKYQVSTGTPSGRSMERAIVELQARDVIDEPIKSDCQQEHKVTVLQ